jgi:hypothetical protein
MFTSRSYAIGMAHFQVSGGFKTLLILLAAYVVGAGLLVGLISYGEGWPLPPRLAAALMTFALVIESLVLVGVGALRVGSCIRLDANGGMLESHRLMPISSGRAILGYLFGTTFQVMVIAAVTLVLLSILGGMCGAAFGDVVMSQIVLAFFALFTWSFAAMGSLMVRQMMPLMIMGFIFGSAGSAFLRETGVLPGVSVLSSPFLGETIFALSRGALSLRGAYALALAAQSAFAALFFVGACRRYRGTYATTFNVPMGLALVAVWSVLSIVAIRNWDSYTVRVGFRFNSPGADRQALITLIASAVLVLVPVHALTEWQRRRPLPAWQVLLALAAVTVVGASAAAAVDWNARLWGVTAAVMAIHAATVYTLFRALRGLSPKSVGILTFVVLLVLWVGPLMAEGIRSAMSPGGASDLGLIGSFSPIGQLLMHWSQGMQDGWVVGLISQALVPVLFAVVGLRLNRDRGAGALAGPSPAV